MVAAALNERNVGLDACLLREWTLHLVLGRVWHANMQNPLQFFPYCVYTSTELRSHLKYHPPSPSNPRATLLTLSVTLAPIPLVSTFLWSFALLNSKDRII